MSLVITLLGLVPSIIQTVVAVEQAATGTTGTGPDKLAAVIAAVIASLETAAPEILHKLGQDKAASFVTNIVNMFVGVFNKIGVFTKKA